VSDGLVYYADPLPGGRAQAMADVVHEGRVVLSWPVGSPAPRESVERWISEQHPPTIREEHR
jgi:hypothetical protein